jgi:nicotinate-nucleotide pyrophosphorylase (carboxylating)
MMLDADTVRAAVHRALAEDIGSGDLTAESTVPTGARGRATVTQKAAGVLFGVEIARAAFAELDSDVEVQTLAPEGGWNEAGTSVLLVRGDAAAILTAERTALNFLQRLSGIATTTRRYVDAVAGTGAQILDTRKTTPGLRTFEKAAVVAGGGRSHRFGLFDAVMVKENHAVLAGGVGVAVRRARERCPDAPLVAECRTRAEVREALDAGAPRLLLDNLSPAELRQIVLEVDGHATLEASGGITIETVRSVGETGVDLISVGAITHSAPALDLSLILEPLG